MSGHEWLGATLVYGVVLWVALSGLDDAFLQAVFFWVRFRGARALREPSERELDQVRQKRIAVFVPLWREHEVVRHMLEHNLAAVRYTAWDFFVGVYPNDPRTEAAVAEVAGRFGNVHLSVCPHPGPTSKADCLNWIYQRMLLFESEHGARFDAVVIHDAEDLIHPESLRLINYWLNTHDMVQVPVLPLPTPVWEFTHGIYCDEFAECQTKDIPVRQFLGGFIASNGVGTGFSRSVLEAVARRYGNRVFEPACLTEDYEAGFRIHAMGRPQVFVPVRYRGGAPVATREYFPREFGAAVRQRTRWVMGNSLQAWERHGWRVPAGQLYWLWRDRKGLVGNLLSPAMNAVFFWGALEWLGVPLGGAPVLENLWRHPGIAALCGVTLWFTALQLGLRTWCAWRVYGAAFAAAAPLRAVFGNVVNCLATGRAMWRYFGAKLRGEPLVWLKTDHTYPARAFLMAHKRPLGEILAAGRYLRREEIETALEGRRPGERMGECLVRTGRLSEDELYRALSTQQSLPLARAAEVRTPAAARLPAALARKWRVVPVDAPPGRLCVAGPELPSDEMAGELERYCHRELRFQLVTPTHYRKLAEQYLEAR